MKDLRFLVITKNDERWISEIATNEAFSYTYLDEYHPDIPVLCSAQTVESSGKEYVKKTGKTTRVIAHCGGGLLKSKI